MKPFFLAKSGRIFGPYSEQDIEALRVSGEYERYSWLWDDGVKRWTPVDPAPTQAPRVDPLPEISVARVAQGPVAPIQDSERLGALCYDHHGALSGWIVNATDSGCEFIAAGGAATPELVERATIFLHLCDPGTGRAMSVSGRVGQVERRAGEWRYRVHWKRRPQIIAEPLSV